MEPTELAQHQIYQARESGFAAMRVGRRFSVTHAQPGTGVTGQTAFSATTPTFLLRQNNASVKVILRSIDLSQTGTVAGSAIFFVVVLDTVDRFSEGGDLVVPKNMNGESSRESGITEFRLNPTVTAAGASARTVYQRQLVANIGSWFVVEFRDGLLVPQTGALLVYTWASEAPGPTWLFNFEWEERPSAFGNS